MAVLLVYLILSTQFKSYIQPLIILSAFMFSIIGMVVNDALVLLGFINRRCRDGKTRRETVIEGANILLLPT